MLRQGAESNRKKIIWIQELMTVAIVSKVLKKREKLGKSFLVKGFLKHKNAQEFLKLVKIKCSLSFDTNGENVAVKTGQE